MMKMTALLPPILIMVGFWSLSTLKLNFQLFFFSAGILSCIIFLYSALHRKDTFIKMIAITGILASTLVIFDIVNNYLFFRDKKHSGFINPTVLQHDTPCSDKTFIYISKKGNDWYYRCPTESGDGIYIVMGNALDAPLIPWPNYYSGKSKVIPRYLHSKDDEAIIIKKEHIIKIIPKEDRGVRKGM